jgi:Ala-tRNA(Pro) deacylase
MSIAASVDDYLSRSGVPYDLVSHTRTTNSSQSAQAAHVPGSQLAKCVMLHDDSGYLMAILPATRRVDLDAIDEQLGRRLMLAREDELPAMFRDCEPGAIPPLGKAYGIDVVLDDDLLQADDVYFEGGDHRALVHVTGEGFLQLMGDAPLFRISRAH